MKQKTSSMVHVKLEMETISKYWMNVGASKKPRDTMQELWDTRRTTLTYLKRSDKMMEAARNFYKDLQSTDAFPQITAEEKQLVRDTVIDKFEVEMTEEGKECLANLLSDEEILEAL
ncbi:hypothetical protein IW262DRAFT_1301743 [Armillaria fumosa]|nr:hypothetical protein IW262DRAFT_1301743 [Armillaria fumosa]